MLTTVLTLTRDHVTSIYNELDMDQNIVATDIQAIFSSYVDNHICISLLTCIYAQLTPLPPVPQAVIIFLSACQWALHKGVYHRGLPVGIHIDVVIMHRKEVIYEGTVIPLQTCYKY